MRCRKPSGTRVPTKRSGCGSRARMVPARSAMVTEPPGGSARSLSSRPSQRRSRDAATTPTIRPSASRSGCAKGSTACRLTLASVCSPIVNSPVFDRLAEVGAVGDVHGGRQRLVCAEGAALPIRHADGEEMRDLRLQAPEVGGAGRRVAQLYRRHLADRGEHAAHALDDASQLRGGEPRLTERQVLDLGLALAAERDLGETPDRHRRQHGKQGQKQQTSGKGHPGLTLRLGFSGQTINGQARPSRESAGADAGCAGP